MSGATNPITTERAIAEEGEPRSRPPRREIDLAVRPANRLIWVARVFVRSLQIAFWLSIAVVRLPVLRLTTGSSAAALGTAITFLFTRLGATFIKVGQIMSTRPDVFPDKLWDPLESTCRHASLSIL